MAVDSTWIVRAEIEKVREEESERRGQRDREKQRRDRKTGEQQSNWPETFY